MRHYVVGFAHDGTRMAFIRKNKPEWQKGRLNGIGGKVEPGETYKDAMVREFEEETGTRIDSWTRICTIVFDESSDDPAVIAFYKTRVAPEVLDGLKTVEEEEVVINQSPIVSMALWPEQFIPNLSWLVPLAMYKYDNYSDFVIFGEVEYQIEPLTCHCIPGPHGGYTCETCS